MDLNKLIVDLGKKEGFNPSVDKAIDEYIEENWYDDFLINICQMREFDDYNEWVSRYNYAIFYLSENPRHSMFINDESLQEKFGTSRSDYRSLDRDFMREIMSTNGNELPIDNIYYEAAEWLGEVMTPEGIAHFEAWTKHHMGHLVKRGIPKIQGIVTQDEMDLMKNKLESDGLPEGCNWLMLNMTTHEMTYNPNNDWSEAEQSAISLIGMAAYQLHENK